MPKGKSKRMRRIRPRRARKEKERVCAAETLVAEQLRLERQRRFDWFVAVVLLAFGVYQSVTYFGHKVVPISDFPDIVRVGHELLSLKVPSRFMQAPVVGLLQASLSYVVGGPYPDLRAGWVLNAVLHPLNLLLFWLVGRQLVGGSAIWFAVIAILNHWVLYLLTEPIIETSLLFFSLLSFYLIFRRSRWAYVAASVTAMVRYEGAALILAAFVMDMLYAENRRERLRAFLYAAAATVPLAIWLLGTFLTWSPEKGHYLRVFTRKYAEAFPNPLSERRGIVRHMRLLWQVGFRPLLLPFWGAGELWFGFCKVVAVVSFVFGAGYGLIRRQWKILMLLLFFVPYFLLHAFYPYPLQRFHSTIFWIALLICLYGFRCGWELLDGGGRVPRLVVGASQVLVILVAGLWFAQLAVHVPRVSQISPRSAYLPWVAVAVLVMIFCGRLYVFRWRRLLRELCILSLVGTMIVSNHFTVVRLLGNGQRDKEFKQLAEWFKAHAKPGDKLGVYMAGVVRMFAGELADSVVQPPAAEDPEQFVKACRDAGITYVVWATREGLSNDHVQYRRMGLDRNIRQLCEPRSIGPYQFVAQVGWEGGYVNIFRLRNESADAGGDRGR